jgi:hypothetical protein
MNLLDVFSLQVADYAAIFSFNAVVTAIAGWIVKTKIEQSIKHNYDKKIEEYKSDIRIREQAVKMAELISLYRSDDKTNPVTVATLNKIAYELSLWLPKDIIIGLKDSLEGNNGKSQEQLLISIRRHLLRETDINPEEYYLHPADILHFEVS